MSRRLVLLLVPPIAALVFLLFVSSPALVPGLVVKWSPFFGQYMQASSNLAGGDLPDLFNYNVELREDWIAKTEYRFGDISERLGIMAKSRNHHEVKSAIYLLRCIDSSSARSEIEKLMREGGATIAESMSMSISQRSVR